MCFIGRHQKQTSKFKITNLITSFFFPPSSSSQQGGLKLTFTAYALKCLDRFEPPMPWSYIQVWLLSRMKYLPMFVLFVAGILRVRLHKMQQQPHFPSFHFPWKCFTCQTASQFWQFVHCLHEMIQKMLQGPQHRESKWFSRLLQNLPETAETSGFQCLLPVVDFVTQFPSARTFFVKPR